MVLNEYSYVCNLPFESEGVFRMRGISSFRCFCSLMKISLLVSTISMFSVIYNFDGTSQKPILRKNDNENNRVTVSTEITTIKDRSTINKNHQDSRKSFGILTSFPIILFYILSVQFSMLCNTTFRVRT